MSNMPTMNDILEFIGDRKVIQLGGFQNDILIKRPAPISDAQPSDISFCGATAKNPLDLLAQTEASLLIVDKNISINKATLFHSGIQTIILLLNFMMNVRKNRAILESHNLPHA
jgi:UDP-3-O-[3-hydroxymyristoyl] glucosamine N-acyltransferase